MKFCTDHWSALRAAIDARGLSSLVAEGGEQAVKNLVSEAQDGSNVDNFDPLMSAHWAIIGNVMKSPVGMSVMFQNEDGSDRCPLCFITSEHLAHCTNPECEIVNYDEWIDRAADGALEAWKELGK